MKSVCLLFVAFLALHGCSHLPRDFEEPESKIVIPSGFLYSGNVYLDEWLNKPFKVRHREATLDEVFRSRPLNGIAYRFEEMPEIDERALLNLDSVGMTRRQLLWSIAQAYDLQMHVEYEGHSPSAIVVMGNPKPTVESITLE